MHSTKEIVDSTLKEYSARGKIPLTLDFSCSGEGDAFTFEWRRGSLHLTGESALALLYGLSVAATLEKETSLRPYLKKHTPRFPKRFLYVDEPFSMEEAAPFLYQGFYNGILYKEKMTLPDMALFHSSSFYESSCDVFAKGAEDYTYQELILQELKGQEQLHRDCLFALPEKSAPHLPVLCHYAGARTTLLFSNSSPLFWSELEKITDEINTPLMPLIHPGEEVREDAALVGAAVIKGKRTFNDPALLLAGKSLFYT